jgi:hypothetical protein
MLRFSSHSKLKNIAKPVPGIVELGISQGSLGRVQWQGTTWPARFFQTDYQDTLAPGEAVKVISMHELTLLVLPLNANVPIQGSPITGTGCDGLWN